MSGRVHVVLLAGGTGSRFGEGRPKQFAVLHGRSVLSYSLSLFLRWLDRIEIHHGSFGVAAGRIVLVTHADYKDDVRGIVESVVKDCPRRIVITTGGKTRHLSSVLGVQALGDVAEDDVIFIHDTARPFVPAGDLDALLACFASRGNGAKEPVVSGTGTTVASLVAATNETLVEAEGDVLYRGLDRGRIYSVKTPQAMRGSLRAAFLSGHDQPEFTDLLRWAELTGIPARLVTGSALNIKLTAPEDRLLLEAVLRSTENGES